MFTGIISDIGTIASAEQRGDLRVVIACDYDMGGVALGASIACSGVCLTVIDKGDDWFAVDVSAETISRTAQDQWNKGARLNLERSLRLGDELGGHIVTGHVDGVGEVLAVNAAGDSTIVTIRAPRDIARYIAAKGSIALDGISLTVNAVTDHEGTVEFTLNLIPHTAQVTTFDAIEVGRPINIEIDILSRYLGRMAQVRP